MKGKRFIFQLEVIMMFAFIFTLMLKAYAGINLPTFIVFIPATLLGIWRALLLFWVVCMKAVKKFRANN